MEHNLPYLNVPENPLRLDFQVYFDMIDCVPIENHKSNRNSFKWDFLSHGNPYRCGSKDASVKNMK